MADQWWSRGSTDAKSILDQVLFTRLAQTIAWCAALVRDPDCKPTLRSGDLTPRLLHEGRDDVVCGVGNSREWRVKEDVPHTVDSFPDLRNGQLMVYFPEADLCDGAAEVESEGFFDAFNTPPWDTWGAYFSDRRPELQGYDAYLLSYVPAEFVDLANRGINVNPEECIQWLSDADVALRGRLRSV